MSLKIALVGYGKMGKAIEAEAQARGHAIIAKIDQENASELANLDENEVDIAIELTHPETAIANFRTLLSKNISIVTGTTGWLDQLEAVRDLVAQNQGSFLYSSNFSIGVNILFNLNRRLTEIMNQYPDYDVYVEEKHHKYKKDAPSGTARSLAEQVIEGLDRKEKAVGAELVDRAPDENELSVAWTRAGEIIGEHSVSYRSEIDEIRISHQAFNRRGFALGAVIAAEFMADKKGFYNFSDIFNS